MGANDAFLEGVESSLYAMSAPLEPHKVGGAAQSDPKTHSYVERSAEIVSSALSAWDKDEALQRTAALAIQETNKAAQDGQSPERIDSGRGSEESVPQLERQRPSPPKQQSGEALAAPPGTSTDRDDSITNSPILRKNMVQIEPSALPTGVPTSPKHDTSGTRARKASLPGFQQLANLADIASQQVTHQNPGGQPVTRAHSNSISSNTSASPMLPYHPISYVNSAQTSPVSFHGFNTRSPISTASDGPFSYGSPYLTQPQAYYAERRSSVVTENGRSFMRPVPSLPSNSSSGESHGTTGSSTEGYSTSHTTPLDAPADMMHQRILPPPVPGMAVIPAGGFKCDWPGCGAQSFQTHYLLSSHRNVHSQNRPHYCPVKDCPRSEGGKGFKRKNEMIRHGLVHNSPGYICPFCPDREHRYPRPDNLQRHVRVHHVDKDRDDPALREVLAQRSEGSVQKQRRRRAQGQGSPTDSLV